MGQPIERVAVLGAGTMGRGIAQVAGLAGFDVVLRDLNELILESAHQEIEKALQKGVDRGKVTKQERQATLDNITTSTDLERTVRRADLVIEAVPEKLDLKRQIFEQVSAIAPDHAILGTNTSSLSVTEIAASSRRPEQVVGMHFFNPPYILKLLELVSAEQTSEETLECVRQAAERMDREIVEIHDAPGFATSRLGITLGLEAMRMVEQGVAEPAEIDKAMQLGYRHPMGPLKLTDLVGLDVRLAIAEYLHAELGERFRPPQVLKRLVRAGHLGKKTGKGFYDWD